MNKPFLILAMLLAFALVVLAIEPTFDIAVARAFYIGTGHFVGQTRGATVVRYAAWALPFLVYLVMLAAARLASAGLVPARFAPRPKTLLVLTLSLAIGPGLLVHATLKEISHRPRPYAVTEFAGAAPFRPFYDFDGVCRHNCAFPSGETAAATWTLAPASLAPPAWRGLAIVGAIIFAAATGLLRMAFGAHFLSDVCAAALITIVAILVVRAATGAREG